MSTSFCTCPHCEQKIEFEIENSGRVAACPSCFRDLRLPNLDLPLTEDVADANATKPIVAIKLISGAELRVKAIRLYHEFDLAKVNEKKAEAMKLLNGVSTGFGPIGGIEWVLAASVVIGAVEGALSSGAQSAGGRLLAGAIQAEQKLRSEGIFKSVGQIIGIENPTPGFWRVTTMINLQVEVKGFLGPVMEKRTVPSAFIHNGDEFIVVQTEDDSVCSIRWSAVEIYRIISGKSE